MKLIYKNNDPVFTEEEAAGIPYLGIPALERTGIVKAMFTTRLGGVSTGDCASMNISGTRGDDPAAVAENKRRLAAAFGTEVPAFTYTFQEHTTNVAVVRAEDKGHQFLHTDGMITDVPGICLVTFYADCVPLYFVDLVRRVIGLSHSGWRGTVARMGAATLRKMQTVYGSRPEDVIAVVGPSICRDCYEVSGDVIDEFDAAFGRETAAAFYDDKHNGHYQLDLWAANEYILREAGIREEHLSVTNLCTCCNPEVLFSHRASHGRRGNVCALLALK